MKRSHVHIYHGTELHAGQAMGRSKDPLKWSSANLLKVDGEQVGNRTMNRRFIDDYLG